jgi:hypothetical protein
VEASSFEKDLLRTGIRVALEIRARHFPENCRMNSHLTYFAIRTMRRRPVHGDSARFGWFCQSAAASRSKNQKCLLDPLQLIVTAYHVAHLFPRFIDRHACIHWHCRTELSGRDSPQRPQPSGRARRYCSARTMGSSTESAEERPSRRAQRTESKLAQSAGRHLARSQKESLHSSNLHF